MTISYADPFIDQLFERMGALIEADSGDADETALKQNAATLAADLDELARVNLPELGRYWARTRIGQGIPDVAFRQGRTYLFADEPPTRTFRTSGTSGAARGVAHYSRRGLALMRASILAGARRFMLPGLDRPAIIRLVPEEAAAPDMVMAHGMELIASTFGDPDASACVVGSSGLDLKGLGSRLDAAIAEERPVLMIGGSFAFVHACEAFEALDQRWQLPAGSRIVDAGGFKGRSRSVNASRLRQWFERDFGVSDAQCVNLFGMTELASQLYDAPTTDTEAPSDEADPEGRRAKGGRATVRAIVRHPETMEPISRGKGLLEVRDLAILDRPHVVLTGDWGRASQQGVAVVGRVTRGERRGCSLTLDALTSKEARA